jgi:uncharacterized protein (TIGR00369 family)
MTDHRLQPRDPDWESRVRASFARQAFMTLIGAEIANLAPGAVDIALRYRPDLAQQHGYFHAGTTTAIADSAAGYAALSLYRAGFGVLTTEFKINLLNPAAGARLLARGRVIKSGRTLTVCQSDVYGIGDDGAETHVATGLFTMIAAQGLND